VSSVDRYRSTKTNWYAELKKPNKHPKVMICLVFRAKGVAEISSQNWRPYYDRLLALPDIWSPRQQVIGQAPSAKRWLWEQWVKRWIVEQRYDFFALARHWLEH
jgi:hypothetical protein